MCAFKSKSIRWFVNTTHWNPTRSEWVIAMRLVGNDEERERINKFVFKKDAKHAIIGRLLIRKCCNYFCGPELFNLSPTGDLHKPFLKRSEKGKPILVQSILVCLFVFSFNHIDSI